MIAMNRGDKPRLITAISIQIVFKDSRDLKGNCMYVCMYACMYVCMHVRTYVLGLVSSTLAEQSII